jgi:GNAT superfamily N-acetyltransferase
VIRDATVDDIPRLLEMGARFVRETVYAGRLVIDPDALARTFGLLIASDVGALFVSERDGVVTGMIGLLAFEHPFTGELAAHELFWWVEPEHRGHGLRLLKRAEGWARDFGAQHVHMVAPTRQVEQVYERLGYGYLEAAYTKAIA